MFRKYFIILIFIVSCEPQEASNIYKAPNSPKYIETFTGLEPIDDTQIISIKSSLEDFLNVEDIKLNENFSFYINIQDIPNYIDCGYMNEEIYVKYIDRIFGSSLKATLDIDIEKEEAKKLIDEYSEKINDIEENYNNQAAAVATLDEVETMMGKGMSTDEIMNALQSTPRRKQAEGGLSYLMGM